jgi:hypothetical protein
MKILWGFPMGNFLELFFTPSSLNLAPTKFGDSSGVGLVDFGFKEDIMASVSQGLAAFPNAAGVSSWLRN